MFWGNAMIWRSTERNLTFLSDVISHNIFECYIETITPFECNVAVWEYITSVPILQTRRKTAVSGTFKKKMTENLFWHNLCNFLIYYIKILHLWRNKERGNSELMINEKYWCNQQVLVELPRNNNSKSMVL